MVTLASVEHCARSQTQPRPLERPANKLAHFGGIKQDFRDERNLFITNASAGSFWSGLRTVPAGPLLMAATTPIEKCSLAATNQILSTPANREDLVTVETFDDRPCRLSCRPEFLRHD
jgi:hypothetical protein